MPWNIYFIYVECEVVSAGGGGGGSEVWLHLTNLVDAFLGVGVGGRYLGQDSINIKRNKQYIENENRQTVCMFNIAVGFFRHLDNELAIRK